ncbi:MAG: hypothetical protein K1W19_06345 [Lachnospiraceae bacterium]|nr:hypothetical protein [Lachnospiraceae bacterium]MCI8824769.1 hypothetical protein [Lachnospiraceae bacterium]MCI9369569.1 hypothetical protein [Lachnospiraceae bacterium]
MKKVLSKPMKQVYGVASLYVNEIRNTGSGTCSNSGTGSCSNSGKGSCNNSGTGSCY